MGSLHQLARELYAEEVRHAREMDATDKLLEGPRLFDRACRLMADGIRHEHPGIDAERLLAVLQARLDRVRSVERR